MKPICAMLLCLFFLTACSQTPRELERGMALRHRLLSAQSCSFDAEITADYGDKLHTFSMYCETDAEGNLSFTVTEPDTIAGITGTLSREGGSLTFGDTALHFELLTDDQLSPVSAPWILMKTLRSGYLTSGCIEDGLVRLTVDDSYAEDALQLDIWLDGNDLPQRAEILYDGYRILSLSLTNFTVL